jgi:hypothetical protein
MRRLSSLSDAGRAQLFAALPVLEQLGGEQG